MKGGQRGHPSEQASFAADAKTVLSLLNSYLVTEALVVMPVRQLVSKHLGNVELHRQFEPQIRLRTAPRQILEVASAALDRRIETSGNQIAQKPDYVEQRALPARVRAYQNVEGTAEFNVHVAQAAEVQSLDAPDHEASLEQYVLSAHVAAAHPSHRRTELEAALTGQIIRDTRWP